MDLAGSRAHVAGLAPGGHPHRRGGDALTAALDAVGRGARRGARSSSRATDEDVHTAIERRVTELAGAVGAKLHTARSRNDQVATDLRLWTREAHRRGGRRRARRSHARARARRRRGRRRLPARATPTCSGPSPCCSPTTSARTPGRSLRDVDRLLDAAVAPTSRRSARGRSRAARCRSTPPSRPSELGFAATFENSLDAVSDRDFVAELLFCVALLGVHLSRMGEELVLWTTGEFGFATLDDRYATGSSMLPQKKNPDVAELARGKAGRLIGNLTGLLATLKGLPLAYNRDLQEDKEPLFDSVDQVLGALRALEGCYATAATFDTDARWPRPPTTRPRRRSTSPSGSSTRGVPFREAHRRVGALVARLARARRPARRARRADGGPRRRGGRASSSPASR